MMAIISQDVALIIFIAVITKFIYLFIQMCSTEIKQII